MKKTTFCMFISAVAMASVLLVSCSRDGGESETLSSDEIIDHISYSERSDQYGSSYSLVALGGDFIDLPSSLCYVSPSIDNMFSAYDKERKLYYFYNVGAIEQPIGEGYQKVGDFTGKYAPVEGQDNQIHYIDREGKVAFDVQAHDVGNFFCGRAVIVDGDGVGGMLYGYINEKGEKVIPTAYYYAERFNEGYAVVWKDQSNWAVIDRDGNEVLSDVVNHSCPVRDGLVKRDLVHEGRLLALNPNGKVLFIYDIARPEQSIEKTFDERVRVYSHVCKGHFWMSVGSKSSIYKADDESFMPLVDSEVYGFNGSFYGTRQGVFTVYGNARVASPGSTIFENDIAGYHFWVAERTQMGAAQRSADGQVIEASIMSNAWQYLEHDYNNLLKSTAMPRTGVPERTASSAVLGDWNNGDELNNVTMTLSGDFAEHDGHKGYGVIKTFVQFEPGATFVVTNMAAEGEKVKLHYQKVVMEFSGDPDDFDSEGEWTETIQGEGDLYVVPVDEKTVRLEAKDSELKGVTLHAGKTMY